MAINPLWTPLNEWTGTLEVLEAGRTPGVFAAVVRLPSDEVISTEITELLVNQLGLVIGSQVRVSLPTSAIQLGVYPSRPVFERPSDNQAVSDYRDLYGNSWQLVVEGDPTSIDRFLAEGLIQVALEPLSIERYEELLESFRYEEKQGNVIGPEPIDTVVATEEDYELQFLIALANQVVGLEGPTVPDGEGRNIPPTLLTFAITANTGNTVHRIFLDTGAGKFNLHVWTHAGLMNTYIEALGYERTSVSDLSIALKSTLKEARLRVERASQGGVTYTVAGAAARPTEGSA